MRNRLAGFSIHHISGHAAAGFLLGYNVMAVIGPAINSGQRLYSVTFAVLKYLFKGEILLLRVGSYGKQKQAWQHHTFSSSHFHVVFLLFYSKFSQLDNLNINSCLNGYDN